MKRDSFITICVFLPKEKTFQIDFNEILILDFSKVKRVFRDALKTMHKNWENRMN